MGSTTHPDPLHVHFDFPSSTDLNFRFHVSEKDNPPLLCTNIWAFGVRVVLRSTKVGVCPVTSTEVTPNLVKFQNNPKWKKAFEAAALRGKVWVLGWTVHVPTESSKASHYWPITPYFVLHMSVQHRLSPHHGAFSWIHYFSSIAGNCRIPWVTFIGKSSMH